MLPVVARASEQRSRQGHAAILGALAIAHPGHEPLGVDVGRLEAQAFTEAQPESVDGTERHATDGVAGAGEQRAHLGGAQHGGQHPRLVDPQELEHGPVAVERVLQKRNAQIATLMLEGACFFCSLRNRKSVDLTVSSSIL